MRQLFLFLFLFYVSINARASAFSLIDTKFRHQTEGPCGSDFGKCEVPKNRMPRIASQDGLGICYACSAATMMQAENCRMDPKIDCSALPKEELFSILDLTRIVPADKKSNILVARSAYPGLKLGVEENQGGDPHATAIIAALYTKKTANEACVSLDKILSKMNSRGETVEAQKAMWERLKKNYVDIQSANDCKNCLSNLHATALDDIKTNLDIKMSNEEILRTFSEKSFESFLDKLTGADKCTKSDHMAFFENSDRLFYDQFPKAADSDPERLKNPADRGQILGKIKEVLRGGRPLSLTGICLADGNPDDCPSRSRHASVIAGYREVCDQPKTSNNKPNCKQSLKVINCWGNSWQEQNDGGWIDADSLIKHTANKPNVLGWFGDKK